MQIPLFHVNAFAGAALGGNPAAVCLLDSWLDDEWLRKVAAENALSATAFLVRQDDDYYVRWFTPKCEVRLCGHATLASGYVLLRELYPERESVRFQTRHSGTVSVRKSEDRLVMDFPARPPKACSNVPGQLACALGLKESPSEVLEVNDSLIAVVKDARAVLEVRPDFAMLEQIHPYVVMVTGPATEVDFVSRYFAPSYGIPEDPVTGSAHCALAPYWTKRLGKSLLHARQLSERGGELWCGLEGDRVSLKGNAVLTMHGTIAIQRVLPT